MQIIPFTFFGSCVHTSECPAQVIRHFWERNDMKGAINAMTKLPDHSVRIFCCCVFISRAFNFVSYSYLFCFQMWHSKNQFMMQVHADVISVLIEKMDVLTLDLFSCLLPVLVGLLDSKIER